MNLTKDLLNGKAGLRALTTLDELLEVKQVLASQIESQEPSKPFGKALKTLRLKYNGVQKFPGQEPLRLWTILTDVYYKGFNYKFSTRSLDGLKELGII